MTTSAPTLTSAPRARLNLVESAAPPHQVPNFPYQEQCQTEWCWAAVAVGIGIFYGRIRPSPSPCDLQGQIADTVLNKTVCRSAAARAYCNIPAPLESALEAAGVNVEMVAGPLGEPVIQLQMQNRRPFGVRIEWDEEHAHYLTVVGAFVAQNGQLWIDYCDPIGQIGCITLPSLAQSYQGRGRWTHTYITG